MTHSFEAKNQSINSLSLSIFIIIVSAAILASVLSFLHPGFISSLSGGTYVSGGTIYDAIYVILTVATDVLYLFGGGVIVFGALLVTIRFIQLKLKDPYQPSFSTRYLIGVLDVKSKLFHRCRNRSYCCC